MNLRCRRPRAGPSESRESPGPSVAFTLVELLVVITLIALLVGILLPSLGKARSTSYSTVCLSNMKQIGVAVSAYLTDQKQRVPMVYDARQYIENGNQAPYGFQNFTAHAYVTMWSDRLVGLGYVGAPPWQGAAPTWATGTGFLRDAHPAKSVFTCPEAPDAEHRWPLSNRIPPQYYFTMRGGWRNSAGQYLMPGPTLPTWDNYYGWVGPDPVDQVAKPAQMIIAGDRGFYGDPAGVYRQHPWTYEWWALGQRQRVSSTSVSSATGGPLAHGNSPRVLYLDGAAGAAPQALLDLQKMPSGTQFYNFARPEVQRAARYFHPAPPATWAE